MHPTKSQKLHRAIKLLKFVVSTDDLEVIKSTIESVIELLEEDNDSKSK